MGVYLLSISIVVFAYEARDMTGSTILKGISSCILETTPTAIQEAMVETTIKVKSLGFNQILFLKVRLVRMVEKWEDRK